jgi:hypothetical protein
MRTTLAIDDDVLLAARALADRDERTVGEVISELARRGLRKKTRTATSRLDYPVLPKRGVVVTMELVNRLRDEEE